MTKPVSIPLIYISGEPTQEQELPKRLLEKDCAVKFEVIKSKCKPVRFLHAIPDREWEEAMKLGGFERQKRMMTLAQEYRIGDPIPEEETEIVKESDRGEFITSYGKRSGVTADELRKLGRVVLPCNCKYDECNRVPCPT